jgi:hypothetical protein
MLATSFRRRSSIAAGAVSGVPLSRTAAPAQDHVKLDRLRDLNPEQLGGEAARRRRSQR